MFKFAKNKSSITTIWHSSFSLYKQIFAKVWYLALAMALISNIVNFIKPNIQSQHIPAGAILLFILMALIVLFISATMMHRIYNLVAKPNYDLGNSMRYTLSKYFILLASMIGLYVVVLIPAVFLLIILAIVKANAPTIVVVFSFWLLLVIYLVISFMFNIPGILFDEKGWLSALKNSFMLVRGNWWHTFVIIMLPMLVMIIMQMLFAAITKNLLFNIVIALVIVTVIFPFIQALILVQYNDLKLRAKA